MKVNTNLVKPMTLSYNKRSFYKRKLKKKREELKLKKLKGLKKMKKNWKNFENK